MKKKDRQRIKKASKLLVSALMLSALSVPAFAEEVTLTDYITGSTEIARTMTKYIFADTETLTSAIETGAAKNTYTIGMNGHNLTGSRNSGITVSSGKSLTINGKSG